ncbi:MAG: M1 family aminopeptidase, partial [Acidobacteriota bacterium]
SEFQIAYIAALIGFFVMVFFVAVAVGLPIVRDEEDNVSPLLHSTPLRPAEYVWGKFGAAYGMCVVVLGLFLASWIVFAHGLPNLGDPEIYGPFELGNYVRPFVVFILPAVTVIAAAAFLVIVFARRALALFVLPLLAFFFFSQRVWGWYPPEMSKATERIFQWLDPSGFRWLKQEWLITDRGLGFYNVEPIVYDTPFLLSRLAWVVVSMLIVGLAVWPVARRARGATWRLPWPRRKSVHVEDRAPRLAPALSALGMTARRPSGWRATWTIFRAEVRELRARGVIWVFLALCFFSALQTFNVLQGPFNTSLAYTPGVAAVVLLGPLGTWLAILLLFYVADALHREENHSFAGIFKSLPIGNAPMLFGKLMGIMVVVAAAMLVSLLAGYLTIVGDGQVFSLAPFAIVWLPLLGPSLILWIAIGAAGYVATGSRGGSYLIGIAVIFATVWLVVRGELTWVTNWSLTGMLMWSDISIFELDRAALVLNRLFVIALAISLFWFCVRHFPRRQRDRAQARKGRWSPAVAVALLVPAVIGWLLWAEISAGFQGGGAERARKDYWRDNVSTWLHAPQPHITSVDLDVELFPERRGFALEGWYDLENRTDEPMSRFALTGGLSWSDPNWTLDGARATPDERSGLYVFPVALQPGETARLGFAFEGTWPKGPTKGQVFGVNQFILPSGVLLNGRNPEFVPVLGFVDDLGVDDDNRFEPWDAPANRHLGIVDGDQDRSWFDHRLRITAPADFTVNATGVKVAETVKDGRKTVVWNADYPVRVFNIIAGRWDVAEGEENTAVFHHPEHDLNVPGMLEALDGALRYYSEWFHPYPWQELRLNEFPGVANYAMGNATNILFSENVGFLSNPRESNAAFAITAHEAAHSWFGHIVGNGGGPGGIVLSEGGAHLATLMLLEQVRGPAARQSFARIMERTYAENRQPDTEKPLVSTTWHRPGDQTVIYDRGGWALWMLKHHMGRDAFLAGLQDYFRTYHLNNDHPLVPDLIASLRPFAPDPQAYDDFVEQFFFDTVIPEYRIVAAETVEQGGGWISTIHVRNAGTGRLPVDIAVTAGGRAFGRDGDPNPDHRDARGTLTLGADDEREITIHSDFRPERVVVDPDLNVLQLERGGASVKMRVGGS